jgi:uncharacterized protein (DUF427 family)
MSDRIVLEPSTEHPITIEPTRGRVQVRVNRQIVADTQAALTLQEATYPAVQYIPMSDVVQEVLTRTDTKTYCPFKGEASYYSVTTGTGDTVETRSGRTRSLTRRWRQSAGTLPSIPTRPKSPSTPTRHPTGYRNTPVTTRSDRRGCRL